MLGKFLDPKNDVAFKKIFGTEKNQDILIHFLNDMLVFKAGKPITKVTFLKTVQDPEIAAKKTSMVDIMCSDEFSNQYIVEMQVADGKDFIKRAQYYAAKAYISQLKIGEHYNNLKEIIFLAITNFAMFPEKKEFKSDHVILDKVTNDHDLRDFSFTFLELTKFNKDKHELKTIIDKWSYFFKNAKETSEKDLSAVIGQDSIIQRAYEELNQFSWSEEELRSYEAVIKRERDHRAILDKQYDDGLAKGRNEGLIQGRNEGLVQGRVEGEIKVKVETAKMMLQEGLSINLIKKLTGLSINEINDFVKQV